MHSREHIHGPPHTDTLTHSRCEDMRLWAPLVWPFRGSDLLWVTLCDSQATGPILGAHQDVGTRAQSGKKGSTAGAGQSSARTKE